MQTLENALGSLSIRKAIAGIDGKPFGSWPETSQAKLRILDTLPMRPDRAYSLNELLDATTTVDAGERYRLR